MKIYAVEKAGLWFLHDEHGQAVGTAVSREVAMHIQEASRRPAVAP